MNKRLLALITALSVPSAFLPTACGDDNGKKRTGTDTATSIGNPDGTAAPGTGTGGVTETNEDVWATAAVTACNGQSSEPESIPAKIEMVVDVSSSMTQFVGNATKWEQTRDAIVAGFVGDGAGALGLPNSVAVGLLFYPNMQTDEKALTIEKDVSLCVNTSAAIPIKTLGADVAGSPRIALREALTGIQLGPQGTPTYDALNYGALTELLDKGAGVSGNPYIVLITDGMPTISGQCTNAFGSIQDVDPEPIVDLIDRLWQEKGVKTFLIGSPGSENGRDWMSRAAVLGQTAEANCNPEGPNWCHMDLTQSEDFGAALTAALQTIAGSVAACSYNIAVEGVEGGQVNPNLTVVLAKYSDGTVQMINRDDTPEDCDQGWYVDTNSNQVVFCSETCNQVQSDAKVQLQVLFGCGEGDIDLQ